LAIMTDTTRPRMIAEKREKQPPSHNQDLFANLQSLHLRNIKKEPPQVEALVVQVWLSKGFGTQRRMRRKWNLQTLGAFSRRACESLSLPD
jgi:hypothetical protein